MIRLNGRIVEIELRPPIEIVMYREWVEIAPFLGWEEDKSLASNELKVEIRIEVIVTVVVDTGHSNEEMNGG